jgi:ribosomal protein S8
MHVKIALGLQREGFLSSVTLGGPTPPKPFLLQSQHDPEQMEKMAQTLKDEPWHAYPAEEETEGGLKNLTEKVLGREQVHDVHVPVNAAKRRLWLGLKYWQNEPVLKNMKLISKPTRRIWLTSEDLGKITRTRESSYVEGLTHPGECMFITTDRGILEARECVERCSECGVEEEEFPNCTHIRQRLGWMQYIRDIWQRHCKTLVTIHGPMIALCYNYAAST